MSDLGGTVARYRRASGLTQATLADRAALSLSYLRKIEQGTTVPSGLGVIRSLATALDIDPRHLVGRDAPAGEIGHPHFGSASAICTVDQTLQLKSANPQWSSLFPGLAAGETLVDWVLDNPRSRIILEDWRSVAHAILWTLRCLGHNDEGTDPEQLLNPDSAPFGRPDVRRLLDLPWASDARRELFEPGAIVLRLWSTRQVRRYTLHVYSDVASAGHLLVLTPWSASDPAH